MDSAVSSSILSHWGIKYDHRDVFLNTREFDSKKSAVLKFTTQYYSHLSQLPRIDHSYLIAHMLAYSHIFEHLSINTLIHIALSFVSRVVLKLPAIKTLVVGGRQYCMTYLPLHIPHSARQTDRQLCCVRVCLWCRGEKLQLTPVL